MKGYITSFESFATLEGPGIRFALFMSGCNLRCAYCHNPDTWNKGKEYSSDELFKLILRYRPYFRNGGGVTFSGGEPLMQTDFLIDLAKKLKAENVHIALDTSCSILTDKQKDLYSLCDLVIADLKFTTQKQYIEFCKGNVYDTVISTLRYLNDTNKPLWVRTVIVPDINDSEKDIDDYYLLIKDFQNIERVELKPFHTLGFSKYQSLGIHNPLLEKEGLSIQKLNLLKDRLAKLSSGAFIV